MSGAKSSGASPASSGPAWTFERMLDALEPLAERGTLAEHLGRLEHALEVLGFDPARALRYGRGRR